MYVHACACLFAACVRACMYVCVCVYKCTCMFCTNLIIAYKRFRLSTCIILTAGSVSVHSSGMCGTASCVCVQEIQDRRSTLRRIGEYLILRPGDVSDCESNDSDEWRWDGRVHGRANERASRLAPTAVSIVKSRKVREARRAIRMRDRERKRKRGRKKNDNRPRKIQKAKEALAYARRFVAVRVAPRREMNTR